jgi:DNA-directed RNA polymerase subunit M/transcription elongation factor TFIIS
MESLSKHMFESRGLDSFRAFVLAARIKHEGASSPRVVPTAKHLISHTNWEWMDRVFRACAALEVKGTPEMSNETLSQKTQHHVLLEETAADEKRIAELLSSAKKERAEGFLVCRNCRSTHVDVDQMQTRSADEPMTLFALCLKCGNRWTKK